MGLAVGTTVEMNNVAGVITFVSPEVDPINRQVRLIAEIDNRMLTLRPGDRADILIHAGDSQTKPSETDDLAENFP